MWGAGSSVAAVEAICAVSIAAKSTSGGHMAGSERNNLSDREVEFLSGRIARWIRMGLSPEIASGMGLLELGKPISPLRGAHLAWTSPVPLDPRDAFILATVLRIRRNGMKRIPKGKGVQIPPSVLQREDVPHLARTFAYVSHSIANRPGVEDAHDIYNVIRDVCSNPRRLQVWLNSHRKEIANAERRLGKLVATQKRKGFTAWR